MHKLELEGKVFGRLTALERRGLDNTGKYKWLCKCECGNIREFSGTAISTGAIQSCGCLQKERARKAKQTHGLSKTSLYRVFSRMKNRCNNPNYPSYKHYGARGIIICDEWLNNSISFINWANKNGYKKGLTIERIDNDKNYCPENCKWATWKEQANNKRNNTCINYKGIDYNITEAARLSGVPLSTLSKRLQKGWSGDKLFKIIKHKL